MAIDEAGPTKPTSVDMPSGPGRIGSSSVKDARMNDREAVVHLVKRLATAAIAAGKILQGRCDRIGIPSGCFRAPGQSQELRLDRRFAIELMIGMAGHRPGRRDVPHAHAPLSD
jgi:hypothetical protein